VFLLRVEGMDTANDTERRLTELEIKLGFADDLLDQMNQTLFRQQQMIERLARELNELRQQVPDSAGGTFRSPQDDVPPHY
jgi:SlyX protein